MTGRGLTILGESDKTPEQGVELIAEVNQPGKLTMQLHGPLSEHDQRVLADGLAAMNTLRSRQAWVSVVIQEQLIHWLTQATGRSRAEIIQQLALELGAALPPEPTPGT